LRDKGQVHVTRVVVQLVDSSDPGGESCQNQDLQNIVVDDPGNGYVFVLNIDQVNFSTLS